MLDLNEGGWDIEPFGTWRDRVSAVWAHRGQGGNAIDYQQWCEALDFVAHAYVYARKPTHGHVSIACTAPGYGAVRALSAAQRAEVLAYLLDGRKPVCDRVHVLKIIPLAVHGRVTLTTYAGAEPTWSNLGTVRVADWDPSQSLLTLDQVPDEFGAGDYLAIQCVGGDRTTSTGEPAIVTATNAKKAYVGTARPGGVPFGGYQPAAGDIVHPSSQTAYQVWRHVVFGYDVGDQHVPGLVHLGPANVDGQYGNWQADVQPARIAANAIAVPGVRAASVAIDGVASPGDDYISTEWPFPAVGRVTLLVPGEWLVLS